MSNLGYYQTLTTIMKKVGGPIAFVAETLGVGSVIGAGITGVIVCICKKKSQKNSIKKEKRDDSKQVFSVNKKGVDNTGMLFNIGDKFRVLEQDKNAVLIEIIGDKNNPHFVKADFLQTISNYERR